MSICDPTSAKKPASVLPLATLSRTTTFEFKAASTPREPSSKRLCSIVPWIVPELVVRTTPSLPERVKSESLRTVTRFLSVDNS